MMEEIMSEKVVLIADPGIDTAFAIALALHDPQLEVLGLIATAGNVSSDRASQNVQILVNQLDPPKWPRVGSALPIEYEIDGTKLHGPDGLGGLNVPPFSLHQPHPGDKVLVEILREYSQEVTVIILGPATIFARSMDREPELSKMVKQIIFLGGAWYESGNATAVAEFHFYCDPLSARRVLQSGAPITLIPLDATRKLIFSPSDLLELPSPDSSTCQFLRQIVPYGIRASSNLYGIEGFHLKDVLGVAALAIPTALTLESHYVDVETRGELTRGMSIVDSRPNRSAKPNVRLATGVDVVGVRDYIHRILAETE
jgi:inosine-uridine nucleoside N-ribohydrolase